MKNIEHISFYDFDDTLFYTPKPDLDKNGRKISPLTSKEYKKSTGENYPHRGWWGRKETLDMDIFNIPPNMYVKGEYLKDIKDDNRLVIMMTGRIQKLSDSVISILDSHNMKFDKYYFNTTGDTLSYKLDTLEKYVKNTKSLKSIKIYDDRDAHIPVFELWADLMQKESNVEIEVIHIKGEKRIN